MKEENILLPGEANFTDEEFTLMKMQVRGTGSTKWQQEKI